MTSVTGNGSKEAAQAAPKRTTVKEEKKFVQISPQSIKLIAEATGQSSIQEEIATSLAEDVSYRLREIAHQCVQILRHSKRRKLNGEDVNQVFAQLGLPKVFGYSSSSEFEYEYVREANVFVPSERIIDFEEPYPSDVDIEICQEPVFEAIWVAPECPKESHVDACPEKKIKEKTTVLKVSSIHKNYHQQCIHALLDDREDTALACLQDLKTNAKLGLALPLIVQSLQKLCSTGKVRNERVACRVLQAIRALLHNPFITTSPFGDVLLPCLLQLVLLPIDYHVFCSVAHTFLTIFSRCRENGSLVQSISSHLHDIVVDSQKPLEERCKAVMVLSIVGNIAEETQVLTELQLLIQAWAIGNNDDAIAGHFLMRACAYIFRAETQRLQYTVRNSGCQYQYDRNFDKGKQIVKLHAMASQCFGDRLQSQLGNLPVYECQVLQSLEKKERVRERPMVEKQYWIRKQNPARKPKQKKVSLEECFDYCTLKNPTIAWNANGVVTSFSQRKPFACYYPENATFHLLTRVLKLSGSKVKGTSVQLGTEHAFYVI